MPTLFKFFKSLVKKQQIVKIRSITATKFLSMSKFLSFSDAALAPALTAST
jgi:hypothetical protein